MLDTKLQNILADVFELRPQQILSNLRREDVDNWDSLKQMDLVLSLERAYDLSLTFDEIIAIQSVQDILDLLAAKGAP